METRAPLILSLILTAAMAATSLWAAPHLPATVATHFSASGLPNGHMSRTAAMAIGPVLGLIFTTLFVLGAKTASQGLIASGRAYITGWIGLMVVITVSHSCIIAYAIGAAVDIAGTAVLMQAVLLVLLGNVLGKTRPNAWVGVRTPWTKRSDLAWDKTNRMAGRLIVLTSLIALLTLGLGGAALAHRILLAGILASAAVCIVLSYVYYRRDGARR